MENHGSSPRMSPQEMERELQAAIQRMKRGDRERALAYLDQLVAAGTTNPVHFSYRGLARALAGRGLAEAEAECREAMVLGFLEPEVYLNLSRVYTIMRRPERALEVLRQGIRAIPGDPKILGQLERLNPRKAPPLSVVPRDHWLNNLIGKWMRGRTAPPAPRRGGGGEGRDEARGGTRVFGISIPSPTGT